MLAGCFSTNELRKRRVNTRKLDFKWKLSTKELACIDTPELRDNRANPIPTKRTSDYLNGLIADSKVNIRRITEDKYGRN